MTKKPGVVDEDFRTFAYEQVSRLGKALASPQRLIILNMLCQGGHSVEELATGTGLSIANTSRHLQVLKGAHLVQNRREGNFIVYSLTHANVPRFFNSMLDLAVECLAELRSAIDSVSSSPARLGPVDRHELTARVQDGSAVALDVRPAREYSNGHLPGAVSIPLEHLEERVGELPQDREIIVICRGRFCLLADHAVLFLRERGFRSRRTDESVLEWGLAGLLLEKDEPGRWRSGSGRRIGRRLNHG